MNYQKIYNNLIDRAKHRIIEKGTYLEKHHIVPRSMGGSNNKDNIVKLTAKEHYLAHHLLWKIYKNRSMIFAFWTMSNTVRNDTKVKINSRTYELLKKEVSKAISDRFNEPGIRDHYSQRMKNRIISKETLAKMSRSRNGLKHTQESKDKISKSKTGTFKGKSWEEIYGKEVADKMKANLSTVTKGKLKPRKTDNPSPLKGRNQSEETKCKISESLKGKTHSNESNKRRSETLKGRKLTESHKENISKNTIGKSKTLEHSQNISKGKKGTIFSEEHKQKIRNARLGTQQNEETKRKRSISLKEYHRKRKLDQN